MFLSFNSFGFQSQIPFGKIKLKDGSKLKTHILNYDTGQNVTIAIADSVSVTIPASQVFKIKSSAYKHYNYTPKNSGFYGSVSFGLLFGKSSEFSGLRGGLALNGMIGYQLNDLMGIGMGSGAEFVNQLILAPLYVRFDGSLNKKRISPTYNLDVGGAFAWYQDSFNNFNTVQGGWFLRPGVGLIFHNLNTSLYLKISYQIQSVTYTSFNDWGWIRDPTFERVEERLMRNLTYTFGIRF